MTEALPTAPTPTTPPPQFASGWQRLGACVLDMIICGIPYAIFSMLVSSLLWQTILYAAFVTAYYLIMELLSQATWGKKLVKIYVAKKNLDKPTLPILTWRYFVWLFPSLPMCYFLFKPEFMELVEQLQNAADPYEKRQLMQLPIVMHLMQGYMLSMAFSLVAGLVLYWLPGVVTKQRTGLHDWLSGTRVYQGKPQPAPSAPDAAA